MRAAANFALSYFFIPILGYSDGMTRQAAKKGRADTIVRGSGNVFADLGLPDAEERQTKREAAQDQRPSIAKS